MKRIFLFFILCLTLISCGPKEEDGELIGHFDQVDMTNVKWNRNNFPLKMKYSNNHQDGTSIILTEAMNEWEAGNTIDFFDTPEPTEVKNFSKLEDYYNEDKQTMGIYLVSVPINDTLHDYLAVTQIFIEKSKDEYGQSYYEIIHGDIIINGAGYAFSSDPDDFTTYYYKTLITHELGHMLGVPHFDNGIMATGMTKEDQNSELTSLEYDYLYDKYQRTPASSESKQFYMVSPDIYRAIYYIKKK